jgi:hypothetical protein
MEVSATFQDPAALTTVPTDRRLFGPRIGLDMWRKREIQLPRVHVLYTTFRKVNPFPSSGVMVEKSYSDGIVRKTK